MSAAHREALAALEWGFRESSGLTLVLGEVGTGKTTLVNSLLARANGGARVVQLNNPALTFEELLRLIIRQIGIHPAGRDKVAYLDTIETFLTDPSTTDKVVVIFDEAQGLSDDALEELRLFSNCRRKQHSLQIVLVGQPELVQRLGEPQLRAINQRIGARAVLRPIHRSEVHDYIDYLIRAQGGRKGIFSARALARVAKLSEGLPRKINNLCNNAMMLAYSEGSRAVKPRHVQTAALELDDVVAFSARRVRRHGIQWVIGKGKPAVIGALSVLAVASFALIVRFENGRIGMWAAHGGVVNDPGRSPEELSKALPASISQNSGVTKSSSGAVVPPRSGEGPKIVAVARTRGLGGTRPKP